jgi:hypothetical protein
VYIAERKSADVDVSGTIPDRDQTSTKAGFGRLAFHHPMPLARAALVVNEAQQVK